MQNRLNRSTFAQSRRFAASSLRAVRQICSASSSTDRADVTKLATRVFATSVAILLLVCAPAAASTYFVSPSGSDSNSCANAQTTTLSKQKLTIAGGVACLAAGDTLQIHAGTYTGARNVIDSQSFVVPSGTSWSNVVTIGSFPGETVIVRPPNGTSAIRLTTGAPQYLVIQDLVLDMVNTSGCSLSAPSGIYLSSGANHNRLLRLEVKNGMGIGVVFSDHNGNSPFNEFVNGSVHDVGTGCDVNYAYGFYVFTSDNLFEGNDIYNNNGYGMHLYDESAPTNINRNIVRRNRIHDNGTGGGPNYGFVIAWGADNIIHDNLVYRNRGGIQVYSGSQNTQVYNNTIFGNRDEGIALQYFATRPIVRNNIVYGNGAAIVNYGGSGTPIIDHNLTTDPRFVNAAGSDFRLQAGSGAENTGATLTQVPTDFTGVARPQGSAFDIGAHETVTAIVGKPLRPSNVRLAQP